jgi:hypothetical protein
MTDKQMIEMHSNAILKIIDNEWQLTREELEQAVQKTVTHIILEAAAKVRLDLTTHSA